MSTTAPAIDAEDTALLVMDYQTGVLAQLRDLADPDALLARVEAAIADVRAHGGTIAYVRVGFTEQDWDAVPATNKTFAAAARYRVMHHQDPSTAIHERLTPEDGDITVRKIRYGAMSTTDLDRQLRERGITTLLIAGVTTSGVVLSTVIDAADRDYRIFVLSDAVDDPDAEAHQALIQHVFPSRAHVISTGELRTLLTAGSTR